MNKTTIRLLFIIGTFVILFMSIFHLSYLASQMSDENWYRNQEEGVIIIEVISGGVSEAAGLQVGDRLVMINGDSVRSANHAQSFLDFAEAGESLIYTIERNDRVFDVKVNLALFGVPLRIVGLGIAGFLFLLFALFLIFLKPEQNYARLLAVGTLFLSFCFMNIQMAANVSQRPLLYQLYSLLIITSSFLTIALLNHAFLYFPEKKYTQINRFWMIDFHYILAGIIIIISFFMAIKFSIFYSSSLLIPLLYMAGVEFANRKRRRKEYKAKQKIIKITGVLIVFVVLSVALIALSTDQQGRSNEIIAFVIILLPLSFFYTTVRYRIFDIYIRIRLSLVYTIIQVFLFLAFVLSLFFLIKFLPRWDIDLPAFFITGASIEIRNANQLSPEIQQQIKAGYQIFFAISFALFLYLIKNRIQLLIDRLFFQQKYDYRNALKQFGELLSSYYTREDIGQRSVDQIQNIMKIKGTSLAFSNNGSYQILSSRGNLAPFSSKKIIFPDRIVQKMAHSKQHLKPEEIMEIESLKEAESLIKCGTPIISGNDKLQAILFTGEKLSESPYNYDDFELLTLFAENLGTAFDRARLYEENSEKERLKKELEIARQIQLNSLPKCDPDHSGLQICSSLTAATEVGGDYYDYLEIDKDQLGVLVADVVGKGTSGAIYMSKIQGFLQTLQLENLPAPVMFERLNTLIRRHFEPDFFFTALYGIFNSHDRTANIYRMGHNGLIYYDSTRKKIEVIEPGGIGFGIANTDQFEKELVSREINYAIGDLFVFLTDGFMESMNSEMQPFGEKKLCDIIFNSVTENADAIMNKLQDAIFRHSSGQQLDDATGIVVKIIS
jgi:serine phosphatase RsbU (regulator of sigma subunit)